MKIRKQDSTIEISHKIGTISDSVVYNGYTMPEAIADYQNRILTLKS